MNINDNNNNNLCPTPADVSCRATESCAVFAGWAEWAVCWPTPGNQFERFEQFEQFDQFEQFENSFSRTEWAEQYAGQHLEINLSNLSNLSNFNNFNNFSNLSNLNSLSRMSSVMANTWPQLHSYCSSKDCSCSPKRIKSLKSLSFFLSLFFLYCNLLICCLVLDKDSYELKVLA